MKTNDVPIVRCAACGSAMAYALAPVVLKSSDGWTEAYLCPSCHSRILDEARRVARDLEAPPTIP